MNIREAIRSRIIGNAPIVSALDSYLTAPAVFAPIIPQEYTLAVQPCIVIRDPTQFEDDSPFRGVRSQIVNSLNVYGLFPPNATDDAAVDAVAMALRQLFRGEGFVAPDGLTYTTFVSGPLAAPVSMPEAIGRTLQLSISVGG